MLWPSIAALSFPSSRHRWRPTHGFSNYIILAPLKLCLPPCICLNCQPEGSCHSLMYNQWRSNSRTLKPSLAYRSVHCVSEMVNDNFSKKQTISVMYKQRRIKTVTLTKLWHVLNITRGFLLGNALLLKNFLLHLSSTLFIK